MSSQPIRTPPAKENVKRGPRTINGAVLDVRNGSIFLGWSEKRTRGMVDRRLVPFKRLGGRIVFLRSELEAWVKGLDGCTLDEAKTNLALRDK